MSVVVNYFYHLVVIVERSVFVKLVVFNLCDPVCVTFVVYCCCLVSEYVLCSINSTHKMVDR